MRIFFGLLTYLIVGTLVTVVTGSSLAGLVFGFAVADLVYENVQ